MKKNDSDSSDNEVDTDHLESEGSYRYNGSADEPYKPEDPEVAGMDRAEPEVSKEGHMFNESNLESGMGVANKEANLSVQINYKSQTPQRLQGLINHIFDPPLTETVDVNVARRRKLWISICCQGAWVQQ
ncbi:hypothetical protein Pst134EA_007246 [Puccinia striiformis f. sp. tritici]|uniref:hypothetical protein n=1 Tax=Puccinia striiformis f. sp. tritici TaxID=168172 RepID=UPI0020086644|nr:hypothetical protein Pst134EA_007246 [Puccinia striiformis f. sp. tritici]KAH9469976.1 hypothetical protein Pst134EA_007246 [Puccinia striiformis f. sp. tritici]